jgi:hypothetical protein
MMTGSFANAISAFFATAAQMRCDFMGGKSAHTFAAVLHG